MNIKDYARIATRILNLIFWMIVGYLAGDLGFGFYFVSFAIFYILVTLLSGAIKPTVAKMVSVRKSKGLYHNCKLVFRYGLLYSVVVGGLVCLLLWTLSGPILKAFIGYRLPESVLAVFGIYFLVYSLKGCIMGYFQGKGDTYVCIVAELLGCIVLIALSPFVITRMYMYGIKVAALLKEPMYSNINGVIGAILVQCVAGLVSIIAVLIGDRIAGTVNRNMYDSVMGSDNARKIYISFGKLFGLYIVEKLFPVLCIAGTTLIYVRNAYNLGADMKETFINAGVFGGKFLIVLGFFMIGFLEYSDREHKAIRNDIQRDEQRNVYTRIIYLLKNSLYILTPLSVMVILLAKPIVSIFFDGRMSLGADMLRLGGILILLMGMTHICKGILNAHKLSLYSLVGSVLCLAVTYAFAFSAKGGDASSSVLITSLIIGYLVEAAGLLIAVYMVSRPDLIDLGYKSVKILIGTAIFAIVLVAMDNFLVMNPIFLIITIALSYALYFLTIAILKGIGKRDINSLKGTLIYYPSYFIGSFFVDR